MATPLDSLPAMLGEVRKPDGGPWWSILRSWPRRRWIIAGATAVGTVFFMALTTAMIPSPIFGRAVPTTWWAWPALIITAILTGLLTATYVVGAKETKSASSAGVAGSIFGYLAVGCPVCNKLALLALGYSGALTWFAPAQPVLAVGGVALLAWALRARLKGEFACPSERPVAG